MSSGDDFWHGLSRGQFEDMVRRSEERSSQSDFDDFNDGFDDHSDDDFNDNYGDDADGDDTDEYDYAGGASSYSGSLFYSSEERKEEAEFNKLKKKEKLNSNCLLTFLPPEEQESLFCRHGLDQIWNDIDSGKYSIEQTAPAYDQNAWIHNWKHGAMWLMGADRFNWLMWKANCKNNPWYDFWNEHEIRMEAAELPGLDSMLIPGEQPYCFLEELYQRCWHVDPVGEREPGRRNDFLMKQQKKMQRDQMKKHCEFLRNWGFGSTYDSNLQKVEFIIFQRFIDWGSMDDEEKRLFMKYLKCYFRPIEWLDLKYPMGAERSDFVTEGFNTDINDRDTQSLLSSLIGHTYREIDNDTARKIAEKNRIFDEYRRTIPAFTDKYADLLLDLDESSADKADDPEIEAKIEAYNNSPQIRIDPVRTDKDGNVLTAAMIEQQKKEEEARKAEQEERRKQRALKRPHRKKIVRRILAGIVAAALVICVLDSVPERIYARNVFQKYGEHAGTDSQGRVRKLPSSFHDGQSLSIARGMRGKVYYIYNGKKVSYVWQSDREDISKRSFDRVIDRMYGEAYSPVNLQTSGKAGKISAREYPKQYYEIYTSKGFPAVEGFS
ncbi:MAG: hypothetical protein ACI4W2_00255, partial [Eubacterium sp.]